MFGTSHVHHQEDNIVHGALYVMFSMRLCKQSARLKDALDTYHIRLHVQIVFLKMNIRRSKHVEDKKN